MNTDEKQFRKSGRSPAHPLDLSNPHCDGETSHTVSENLECGDLSPLFGFGDLSPKQGRVQRPGRFGRLPAFDGDKSPAESADKSAHSEVVAAPPRCVHL